MRGWMFACAAMALTVNGLCSAADTGVEEWPDQGLRLSIEGRGEMITGYALFARPGEEFRIHALPGEPAAGGGLEQSIAVGGEDPMQSRTVSFESTSRLDVHYDGGALTAALDDGFVWNAPEESGWSALHVRRRTAREIESEDADFQQTEAPVELGARIDVCVFTPYKAISATGAVDGYMLGLYPNPRSPSASAYVSNYAHLYEPPEWFIPVTSDTLSLKISPHFRLGEFAEVAEEGRDHFIALDYRLIQFLEALRVALHADSDEERPLRILRAYMSPQHRLLLDRQGVEYPEFTRYQYGDAAAIVVDSDDDGRMDDLNGDGVIDINDAELLAQYADETQERLDMWGGVGVKSRPKDPALPDTPCVDVDMRGIKARW